MFQQTLTKGSRVVHITANTADGPFDSRLYVNHGEDATLNVKKAKTLAGAIKQAEKMLERR